jgi:hypothetical protein
MYTLGADEITKAAGKLDPDAFAPDGTRLEQLSGHETSALVA